MNSRERVLTAMNHVRPDRVPINFRSVDTVADRMEHYYSKSHQELLEYLQVDFREVIPPYTGPAFPKDSNGNFFDEWGVRRKEVVTDRSRDVFVDYSPLADVEDLDEIRNYPWPDVDAYDYSCLETMCREFDGYAISGPGLFAEGYHGVFHQLTYLFGMEQAMMNLLTEEELVKETIKHITAYWTGYFDRMFTACKGKLDFIFYKDDMGSQNSLLVSQDVFRKFFKPSLKELCDLADSYGAAMIYHTCGSVKPLIPDFIDAGVKVLDPIQTSAKDMDIRVLKDSFGDKVTFHGAIDTQQVLPNSSPEEIIDIVKHTLSVLGKDGGYFFSPSHRIQQDTPIETIVAMYDTVRNWNDY